MTAVSRALYVPTYSRLIAQQAEGLRIVRLKAGVRDTAGSTLGCITVYNYTGKLISL